MIQERVRAGLVGARHIREARAEGLSIRAIAARCGVSVGTVHRVLTPASPGLTTRTRHEATFDDRGGLTVRAVEEPNWH
jgi:Helix-turn-helix domain